MKKSLILLLTYILLLSGCGADSVQHRETMKIVCTSFPYYDFARNIAGERAEVTLLVPPGAETHSFDPTPKDIIAVSEADIFIANGGESEEWVEKLVSGLDEMPENVIYMTEQVELIKVDGHTDEHIWTSPKNAEIIVGEICNRLVEADRENAEYYHNNLLTYMEKLSELDRAFSEATEGSEGKTVVFGDRFPFVYLMTEYGVDYKAAFSGCSELTEADAKTVSELVEKVKEDSIPIVFYVEFSNRMICDAICAETGAQPQLMHSVHNLTKSEFDLGYDYIGIMTKNAAVLKEALG